MTAADGIAPSQAIRALIESGAISLGAPVLDRQIQPASLDLRLGKKAYRVRASFLPGPGQSVRERLNDVLLHEFSLENGAVLETGCVYLVPLLEGLALPAGILAATNPKSSTGRLDVFTRVIADGVRGFDTIPEGYAGPLWAEVSPRTFPVLVRTGSRLSQIRFRRRQALLGDRELERLHEAEELASGAARFVGGLALSIDLSGGSAGLVGYRGKRHTGVIDVDRVGAYDVADFWEPLTRRGRPELVLDPDQFYILVSGEAVHVPPGYAAEMVPFDPLVGEFRVHYAGFFDPGFGHGPAGGRGSRAVLEVRSHEVPFILEHGQTIGRLVYEPMARPPGALYGQALGSNYQAQGLKLSKHFRAPG